MFCFTTTVKFADVSKCKKYELLNLLVSGVGKANRKKLALFLQIDNCADNTNEIDYYEDVIELLAENNKLKLKISVSAWEDEVKQVNKIKITVLLLSGVTEVADDNETKI